MKRFYLLLLLLSPAASVAQYVPRDTTKIYKPSGTSVVDFGIGVGLDYGGIGGRLTVLPDTHFGLFGAVGYAISGAGYNLGTKARFNPKSTACVTTGFMYGYNAVIKVSGAPQYDKVYYGASIFLGCEIRSHQNPRNYGNIELVVPFRSSEFTNDLHSLQANPAVTGLKDPLPIALSFGYHFGF